MSTWASIRVTLMHGVSIETKQASDAFSLWNNITQHGLQNWFCNEGYVLLNSAIIYGLLERMQF
jgi:hypothetical protein